MSENHDRTPEQLRADIDAERQQLVDAVDHLRESVGNASTVAARMKNKLPIVATGAGFVLGGGLGATMRLLARRGRGR
jgi:Protein of unknown function (DUF3618)